MATFAMHRTVTHIGPLQIAIVALVAVTALVHLSLAGMTVTMIATQPALVASMGGAFAMSVMAALFARNFGGYVILGTALRLPSLNCYQPVIRWALIALTAVTILAYVVLAAGHYDAFGITDKACEVMLIALLLIEGWQTR